MAETLISPSLPPSLPFTPLLEYFFFSLTDGSEYGCWLLPMFHFVMHMFSLFQDERQHGVVLQTDLP